MSNKIEAKLPSVINKNKNLAALVSKLNTDNRTNDEKKAIKVSGLPDISNSIKDKIANNETIVKLFPDIELSIQIMVSSILAPNDMGNTNLIYSADGIDLPTDVKAGLLENIKTYVSSNYKLEDKLTDIIREALFTKGAYIEAVIPEASVDSMINANDVDDVPSLESLVDGNLNNSTLKIFKEDKEKRFTYSLEDMDLSVARDRSAANVTLEVSDEDLGIAVTDNFAILGATVKMANIVRDKVSLEALDKSIDNDDADFFNKLFKPTPMHKDATTVTVLTSDETDRASVGKPLIMKLPVEATIPVYISGDATKHLGYFVLLDEKGVPVVSGSDWSIDEKELDQTQQKKAKSIIDKASAAINGYSKKNPKMENIEEIYGHIVDQRLKAKLANSLLGDLADISEDNSEAYRTMLTRVLAKQKTKILFIPSELVAFYAFKYRDNGTGESLLETISVLSSIRAILLFARIMANIKNSVTTTEISATLDEKDLDPTKTMEKIISEVMKSRGTQMPIGVTRVEDLVDWTKKVGYKFNFKHSSLPDMDISTNEETTSKAIPDSDLDEDIRKQILMSFSLPPKAVEDGYDSDFATTIVQNNLLFTKRVMMQQDILMPLVTKHVRILLKNDMDIFNAIKASIEKNIKPIIRTLKKSKDSIIGNKRINEDKLINWLTTAYINNIEIRLPRIEEHETDNMKEAFDNYKESIEDYIEIFFSDEALPEELAGELSGRMEDFKMAMQNTFLRKWMADNNYLPEALNSTTLDKDGNPVFDVYGNYETYLDSFSKVLIPFIKKNNKLKETIDKKLAKLDGDGEADDNDDYESDNDNVQDDDPDNSGDDDGAENEPNGDGGDGTEIEDEPNGDGGDSEADPVEAEKE